MDGFQGTRSQNSMFSGRNSTGTLNSAFSSENSPKQIQSGAAKERIATCGGINVGQSVENAGHHGRFSES